MKKALLFPLLFILALTLTPLRSSAWWDTGHMVVAQIGYDELKPETRKWADSLIATVTANYPKIHGFVEASTWPDDIKGNGIKVYDSWHYTNIPLNEEGLEIPCTATPEIDVVWAIGQARWILSSPKSTKAEKGQFLAFLIHFVGDLHQPLHSTSMYSKDQPGGNLGGNLFPLKDSLHNNLHKLWDDGCGYFDPFGKIDRVAGPSQWTGVIEKIAKQVTKAYPRTSIPMLDQLDAAFWAKEGNFYAVNAGYKGLQNEDGGKPTPIKPNDTPSPSYLKNGKAIVEMRLAAGGYRLGMVINKLYDTLYKK
jgi:hypothetical protein